MQELIVNSLETLSKHFRDNELAYLSLTTKIELPLRDRWAFLLFREIGDTHNVSREWRRTDLAILKDQSPQVLIELKAMYSFDAALDEKKFGKYTCAMSADEMKAKKLAEDGTEIYTVLLATHPESLIPSELDGIVKYVAGVNKAINKFGSPDHVKEVARNAVNNDLNAKNVVASGSLAGGVAFGTSVSILYWIVKA